ncbi:MAG TPA: hypothetical protein VJR71_16165 [Pseudolabrys sp.]|nr:hypothetical protein [Pseudolabrys sp.]
MLAVTFGSFRKLAGSVSIAVDTARPVAGHLIITKLMGDALRIVPTLPDRHGTQGS